MRISFVPFLAFFLILSACSKEKSKRWLVLDVTIHEKFKGIPEECLIEIGYDYMYQEDPKQQPYQKTNKYTLGKTTNGHFTKEVKISKALGEKYLYIYATPTRKAFENYPYIFTGNRKHINLETSNYIEYNISQGYYLAQLTCINTNCFDDTDSMWFTMSPYENFEVYSPNAPPKTYINNGCQEKTYFDSGLAFFLEDIYFKVIRKKNNVIDTTIHHFKLTAGVLNELEIKY